MKAFFLYDDKEHATPLLRAMNPLREQGILLSAVETHSAESAVRLVPADTDVVLIHQHLMSDDAIDCGKPVIIIERVDGAQLAASRKWLPQVAGVIKGYTYRPPELHNTHRSRHHTHLLKAAGVTARTPEESKAVDGFPSPQVSSADLAKIHAGWGFGAYAKMDGPRAQMVDFASEREYQTHYVGHVNYNGCEIEAHRRLAVEAVKRTGEDLGCKVCYGEGRPMRPTSYLESMLISRTVVSPYGWGEACHRDYEAMLLGALVIKPSMEHVVAWPEVFRRGETYVACEPDFSDVPCIVETAMQDWQFWRPVREEARQLAWEAGNPKRLARRMVQIFEKCL